MESLINGSFTSEFQIMPYVNILYKRSEKEISFMLGIMSLLTNVKIMEKSGKEIKMFDMKFADRFNLVSILVP